jgi:DNA-directed RNA polymerase subunit RPC12/RpoP
MIKNNRKLICENCGNEIKDIAVSAGHKILCKECGDKMIMKIEEEAYGQRG